jgi:hypothetical protein
LPPRRKMNPYQSAQCLIPAVAECTHPVGRERGENNGPAFRQYSVPLHRLSPRHDCRL